MHSSPSPSQPPPRRHPTRFLPHRLPVPYRRPSPHRRRRHNRPRREADACSSSRVFSRANFKQEGGEIFAAFLHCHLLTARALNLSLGGLRRVLQLIIVLEYFF